MPSFVDSNYVQRGGIDTADRETGTLVPFTFASRGENNALDNVGVPAKISSFPDADTDTGLTGFIRSFSCDISGETYELSFSLEFETAVIVP